VTLRLCGGGKINNKKVKIRNKEVTFRKKISFSHEKKPHPPAYRQAGDPSPGGRGEQ